MRSGALAAVLTMMLWGCGSVPVTPKKAEAPPEAVTGLHALYQMFAASHGWAPDAQVYQLTSIHIGDVKAEPGKEGAWQVVFVSPSLQQTKTYTYSVTEASISMHKGITSGKAESWSGPNRSTTPFVIAAAKVDSDEAYKTAKAKAADFDAKHPGMQISCQLAQTSSYNNAAWRIIWGESASSSIMSVLVDATTGKYVETLH